MANSKGPNGVRKEKLLLKLLNRVFNDLGRVGVEVDADTLALARACLLQKWSEHQGNMSDKDLRQVINAVASTKRSSSAMDAAPTLPKLGAAVSQRAVTPGVNPTASVDTHHADENRSVHNSTTRRQRQMMAEQEWISAAEQDRVMGAVMKQREREMHNEAMQKQRNFLDRQLDEHRKQQEADRREKLRLQQEMDDNINQARFLQRQEQQNALKKAQRERDFREKQRLEQEAERERQRVEEHNEQVKQSMMVQDELRRQKEADLQRKLREQEEWKNTVRENQQKLMEKANEKEKIKALDREYQRIYNEAQLKQDRERQEAKERKEKRLTYFQGLASGVAALFQAKEQDQTSKINAEYERQQQKALEDERNRVRAQKSRLQNCLETQTQQIAERKQREAEEKEAARRYAAELQAQAQESFRIEDEKRRAAKIEAMRTRDFLGTQLQMAHVKETKPLETSITRPISVATTMFSPSRHSAASTTPLPR